MSTKSYLYRRPAHINVRMVEKDPETGTNVEKGTQVVVAFAGISEAVKATSMQAGQLVDSIRLLKKLDAPFKHGVLELVDEYIVVTEAEKALMLNAVNSFNWSKFSADTGNTVWINWIGFLAGFNEEFTDEYKFTWTEYDPLNPPVEYAEWKLKHAAAVDARLAAIKQAEEAAVAAKKAAEQTTSAEEGAQAPASA